MSMKVFVILCNGDKDVAEGVGLRYSFNAAAKKWMDDVKVILFGPSEELVAKDPGFQAKIKELQQAGVEVIACKAYSDEKNITGILESAGLKVAYVGAIISQLLKDGWASLTF